MSRPLRIEYENALYHVTSRGNRKEAIFFDDQDRWIFLNILDQIVKRYHWMCYGYCLMTNHYHLLIETPRANLSEGMRQVNGIYTQAINRKYRRPGHLFQGRFKAVIVEKDAYLLELCRYIVLNPVKAGLVKHPGEWRWSSYSVIAGTEKIPKFLDCEWILSQFGKNTHKARQQYREFIADGKEQKRPIWENLKGHILLGTDQLLERIKDQLERKVGVKEICKAERLVNRPALRDVFVNIRGKSDRNEKIYEAHVKHGYRLKEISDFLKMHYSTVSKITERKKNDKFKT